MFVFLVSCDCYRSVALSHSAVGWSVMCDCGMVFTNYTHVRFLLVTKHIKLMLIQ